MYIDIGMDGFQKYLWYRMNRKLRSHWFTNDDFPFANYIYEHVNDGSYISYRARDTLLTPTIPIRRDSANPEA